MAAFARQCFPGLLRALPRASGQVVRRREITAENASNALSFPKASVLDVGPTRMGKRYLRVRGGHIRSHVTDALRCQTRRKISVVAAGLFRGAMSLSGTIEGSSQQTSVGVNVGIVSGVRIHAERLAASLAYDFGANRFQAVRVEDCTPAHIANLDLQAIVVDSSSVQRDTLVHVFGVHESIVAGRVAIKLIAYGLAEGDEEAVLDFASLGATGFLYSDATFAELGETLRSVLSGDVRCPRKVTVSLLRHYSSSSQLRSRVAVLRSLTPRQRQALVLRLSGKSNKLVAASMGIEVGTVKREIHDAYKKLRVHALADVARLINDETGSR